MSTGTVTRVHDGDTVTVATEAGDELEVRLIGVNSPERGECHSEEALRYMVAAVSGREVALTTSGTDRFGRALAHLWVGSRHVNVDLVTQGHAIATTIAEGDPHREELIAAEGVAATSGAGLWGDDACGASGPRPEVRIARVHANPPGPDEKRLADEVVVIVNQGDTTVDLSGWILRDESSRHRYRVPAGSVLGAGEEVTVTSADRGWIPGGGPVWNNNGDMALLLDETGRVVSRLRY